MSKFFTIFVVCIFALHCNRWSAESDVSFITDGADSKDSFISDVSQNDFSVPDYQETKDAGYDIEEQDKLKVFSFKMDNAEPLSDSNFYFQAVETTIDSITVDVYATGISNIFGIAGFIIFPHALLQFKEMKMPELFGSDGMEGIYRSSTVREGELTFALSHLQSKADVQFMSKEKIATIRFKPMKSGTGLIHFVKKKTIAITADASEIQITPVDAKIDIVMPY
jgi:hypothetical protein